MKVRKIRFFGSDGCEYCMKAYLLISQYQIECEYVDANADDDYIQALCDQNNVYDLPHLQFLSSDDLILYEHVGPIEESKFIEYAFNDFLCSE
jgi:glutaredoxin